MAGKRKESQTNTVADLLGAVEAHLKTQTKGTLGDYIRLMQLQKEMEEDDPRDLKVGWVDKLEEETTPEKDSGPSSS